MNVDTQRKISALEIYVRNSRLWLVRKGLSQRAVRSQCKAPTATTPHALARLEAASQAAAPTERLGSGMWCNRLNTI